MTILVINSGSSSIKAGLFEIGDSIRRIRRVTLTGIGQHEGRFTDTRPDGSPKVEQQLSLANHAEALWFLGERLADAGPLEAIGHRIVHGGPRYFLPAEIDELLLAELKRIQSFLPLHLPAEIEAIHQLGRLYPQVRQVACFDTGFHHNLPPVAQAIPLPAKWLGSDIRRYGFHGLSYQSILRQLREMAPQEAQGRIVVAHLGSGASLAAIRDGVCLDTTMSFTPTAGIIMATRPGDLDPGLLAYLMRQHQLSPDQLEQGLNTESGVAAIAGGLSDFRELLERESTDENAKRALDLFCYRAKQAIGSLSATLGGLDTLVYTAGVGENAAPIRERISAGLEFLGIQLDHDRNTAGESIISAAGSRVVVRVLPSDEEMVIARQTRDLLRSMPPS